MTALSNKLLVCLLLTSLISSSIAGLSGLGQFLFASGQGFAAAAGDQASGGSAFMGAAKSGSYALSSSAPRPPSGTGEISPRPGGGARDSGLPVPGPDSPATSGSGPALLISTIRNVVVSPGAGTMSTVFEPAVANNGNTVFYTGNWIAARSTNGGTSWTFVNPYLDVNGNNWGFCCDQDVVFDPNRRIFIWYRQGSRSGNTNENTVRIDISTDALNWCEYTFAPKTTNSAWAGSWWDFPHLALSSNFVYVTTNRFPSSGSATDILRLPLFELSRCSGFTYNWYEWGIFTSGADFRSFAPVDGASSVMYWSFHQSNSQLRVFAWPESGDFTSITYTDISHTAFTTTGDYGGKTQGVCTDPAGGNACGRMDDRGLGGYVAGGIIGFFWNVAQGSGFPYPYVRGVTINQASLTLASNVVIWNPNYAWIYAAVAPNSLGQVGLAIFLAGGGNYPSMYLGLTSDIGGTLTSVTAGTGGPSGSSGGACSAPNCWGDYLRVRPYSGNGASWVATGFTLQGGNSYTSIEARYYVFPLTSVILTSLSLTVSPSSINPRISTAFSLAGRLTAMGSGLAAKTILILQQWDSSYLQLTTQNDGSYSLDGNAPSQDGVYTILALFYGDSLAGTIYGPSLATATLTVQSKVGFTLTVKVQTSFGGAISGYTLQLLDSTEKLIGQGNTDGTGTVKFTGLTGGTYFLIGFDSQAYRCSASSATLQISKDTTATIDCSTGKISVTMNPALGVSHQILSPRFSPSLHRQKLFSKSGLQTVAQGSLSLWDGDGIRQTSMRGREPLPG